MKRRMPAAVAALCFLLLGLAVGFAHRFHHHRLEVRRTPVVHAAACLEALVHLRQGRRGEAVDVLRRHRDRFASAGAGEAAVGLAAGVPAGAGELGLGATGAGRRSPGSAR